MPVGICNFNVLSDLQWPADMTSRFRALSYKEYEERFKEYKGPAKVFGKFVSSCRGCLNMVGYCSFLEGTSVASWTKWGAKKAKILSVLGLPFSVFDVCSSVEKIVQSIHIDDHEGVFANALGSAATSAGTLDSVATVTNAFRDIIGMNSIQFLADISLPIGFFITGIDTSSRGMRLSKVSKLYQEIDPSSFFKEEISGDDLRRSLQRRFGIRKEAKSLKRLVLSKSAPEKTLEERKNAKLLRLVSKGVEEDVDQVFTLLSMSGKQPLTLTERKLVAEKLQKIRCDLEKKMVEDTIMMLAAVVSFVGLTFFCMQGMGCLPYVVQMIASVIKSYTSVCVETLFDVSPVSVSLQRSLNFTH